MTLRGLSDIRRWFAARTTPTYFISATNFNLLGIDEWIGAFRHINYLDCFDGTHPAIFVPGETPHEPFTCLEDVVNHLSLIHI